MKEEFVNQVCDSMSSVITQSQLNYLKNILYASLEKYSLSSVKNEIVEYTSDDKYVQLFLIAKKMDGCTDATLGLYRRTLTQKWLHLYVQKPVTQFTRDDLQYHFAKRMIDNPNLKKTTLNSERRVFSSFFAWLHDNEYISKNPMATIKKIKMGKEVKEPYTEEEIEKMRSRLIEKIQESSSKRHSSEEAIRNLAIFEFLLSTGCRVSELTGAKKENLDLEKREVKVFGKGQKWRTCFLSAVAAMRLKEYLSCQLYKDSPYIFTNCNGRPENGARLEKPAVEIVIRYLGRELGIKAYPHKFRRTCATMLLKKGMPIEQVKIVLGHESIDTTLIYAHTEISEVKFNHDKYI